MLASGSPGALPRWGPGRKDGFGTAPGNATRTWFTLADGSLSEVCHPRLDRPVLTAVRFIVSAPGFEPIDDSREAAHELLTPVPGVLHHEITSRHAEYALEKRFVPMTECDALLVSGEFHPEMPDLRLYVQLESHWMPGSPGNDAESVQGNPAGGFLVQVDGQVDVHVAMVGPFALTTAGFLDTTDVLVDLHDGNGHLGGLNPVAEGGHATLAGELALHAGPFQMAIGFGATRADAEAHARLALRTGYTAALQAYRRAWARAVPSIARLEQVAADGGALARHSVAVLSALEDRQHSGAFVAAPCAPWGQGNHDGNHLYSLVWSRDLYHVVTALLEAGITGPAERALRHLASVQRHDGSWPQNWTVSGEPHWTGSELDGTAFPCLLAWRLAEVGALDWDPYFTLMRPAALHLLRSGPGTQLDRWEDAGGLSPSTIAAAVAALVVTAEVAIRNGEQVAAAHLRTVADYWADRVDDWCWSQEGNGYVRLATDPDGRPAETASISADFLELVRHGVKPPDHPAVLASLARVDSELRRDLPQGVAWRRYSSDQYGETEAGEPWPGSPALGDSVGVGRCWPILLGERAQHQVARGFQVADLIRRYESFAGPGLLFPEQVWDGPDIPGRDLHPGRATNSAQPLAWAHAEYLKLLAAVGAARCQDAIPCVRGRYVDEAPPAEPAFVWSQAHAFGTYLEGRAVRIQLEAEGTVRWSMDGWRTWREQATTDTGLGLHVVDLPTQIVRPGATIQWTIRWVDHWEGVDRALRCVASRRTA